MKILFVSMPSLHAARWINNLIDTDHQIYWFDVLNRGRFEAIGNVEQLTNWKERKVPYIKGEYFLSKRIPALFEKIQPLLEVTSSEAFSIILRELKPDVVHSFEMQSCSYPLLKVMEMSKDICWIYSSWGNDLFYYKGIRKHESKIKRVLGRVDFLHTDNQRDLELAVELGFKGRHAGIIPGGGGYNLEGLKQSYSPLEERKIILIKGYQHNFGRGLNVIKALSQMELGEIQVVVFGAHPVVREYVKKKGLQWEVYGRHLDHEKVLLLMGKSMIYVGNSISDGIPNTLLESMVMGAFPIQSNPGGVTEEIIEDDVNGLLIRDSENISEIKFLVNKAICDEELRIKAAKLNYLYSIKNLERETLREKILNIYALVAKSCKSQNI